jgi:preprotein translocase subunit SecE
MNFLEYLKISDNWWVTGVVYGVCLICLIAALRSRSWISRSLGEVTGELRKASWPWESDKKIKGIRKYKELIDSTVVVLIATILLAGFVSLLDFLLIHAVNFIIRAFGS